jgi:hypothetical protein
MATPKIDSAREISAQAQANWTQETGAQTHWSANGLERKRLACFLSLLYQTVATGTVALQC